MGNHSILAPSSAARRIACPGSVKLTERFTSVENEASQEGVVAHEFIARLWAIAKGTSALNTLETDDATAFRLLFAGIDLAQPDDLDITEDMREGARLFFEEIDSLPVPLAHWHVEEFMRMPSIHPEMFGTPDAWSFYKGTLHIIDYKFGHGYVDVYENWQLICYAAGALDIIEANGIADQHINVIFTIVQPRNYCRDGKVRRWEIKASALRAYFNILRGNSEESLSDAGALCKTSPECGYCPARHACYTLQQSALIACDIASLATAVELKGSDLASELSYLQKAQKLIDARLTGLEQEALAMIKRGDRIPGYSIEQSRGREIWNVSKEEVFALGQMFDVNLVKPRDSITPKQAISAGLPKEIASQYSHAPLGSWKLVVDDASKIRKIFTDKK